MRYIYGFLLFLLTGASFAENGSDNNWTLVSENSSFWLKTVNTEGDTLLLGYAGDKARLLLVPEITIASAVTRLPAGIRVDQGPEIPVVLKFIKNESTDRVAQIVIGANQEYVLLSRMIAGLALYLSFEQLPDKKRYMPREKSRRISFSLKGFTVALNDLLIAEEAGSLDRAWLLRHKKDRELYCLMTAEISIEAMQYRLKGESYNNTLRLVPETGYTIIDHNLGEIIEQVYKIPQKELPQVPRAEKYLMFSNCMEQPFN